MSNNNTDSELIARIASGGKITKQDTGRKGSTNKEGLKCWTESADGLCKGYFSTDNDKKNK